MSKQRQPYRKLSGTEHLHSQVFRQYFDSLYQYGIKLTRNPELAEDCIQDLFFRMWKNNVDLSNVQNVKSYLLKSLRRQIFNVFELQHYKVAKADVEEAVQLEFSAEDYYIKHQTEENLRTRITTALNKLSPKQREAVYLRYFEELNYQEVAEVMNINLQSAKNTVSRALDSLKDLLTSFLVFYLLEKLFAKS